MAALSEVASVQAVECLRLHVVDGIGPQRFGKLIQHFGSVAAITSASLRELQAVPTIGRKTSDAIRQDRNDALVERELRRAADLGARIICQDDQAFPTLLKQIPDAPICLYVKGRLLPQDDAAVAVVGARRCTHYGSEQAYRFGMQLARTGLTVVSGLARGVDMHAHRGAVDCKGRTIAVLGCGLGHLAAHENAELADHIACRGAVVSELPIDRPPDAANFPPRNRIIAGLSRATLVIEAARRSGALITARLACEYDREVLAVPGRVDNDLAAGTNKLIQDQHAKVALSLQDILSELGHICPQIKQNYLQRAQAQLKSAAPYLNEVENTVFSSLDAAGVDLECISNVTQLPAEKISNALMMLQLKGIVEQLPGNRFARII
jgi:DNA processing protein